MIERTISTHLEHIQQQRRLLVEYCERLEAVLVPLESSTLQDEVQRLKQRLQADTLTVLVLGEHNRGKSTVINALLGQRLLPAYPVPTTALLSEVKWGAQPRLIVHTAPSGNGLLRQPQAVPLTELEHYLVINVDEEPSDEYERVELFWPLPPCFQDVVFIDSPALDEDERYLEATMCCLPSVDAVLFVLGCDFLPGKEETRVIERTKSAGHEAIFFLCNRVDLVDPHAQERVKQRWLRHLSQLTSCGEQYISFTNAKEALAGRSIGNREQLQHSNLLLVEEALYSFLAGCGHERVRRAAAELQMLVHKAIQTCAEQEVPDSAGGARHLLVALAEELHKFVIHLTGSFRS